jgi:tRNA pseudouridine32 synthase/23S rRNA pseudouridine746 synthase
MKATSYKIRISRDDPPTLCEAIAVHTGLSKTRIKIALNRGAVWARKAKGKRRRIRRATSQMRAGDQIYCYYDEAVLNLVPPQSRCIRDFNQYSIWHKPAGLMTQGSRFGDHCSLGRQIEQQFTPKRCVFLVHRIDREATGLVLVAHDRTAAAKFSSLFRLRKVQKRYRIHVTGNLYHHAPSGRIEIPLDNREASTTYRIISFDPELNQSVVEVELHSGRRHQIRRHFDLIGFPVIGDPRYGINNKNKEGMQLVAYALAFKCPLGNGSIHVEIDPDEVLP